MRSVVATVVAALVVASVPAPVQAAPVTIANGIHSPTRVAPGVHAHGGGVLEAGSYWYWFGENRNADDTFRAVSVYRSAGQRTWEFRTDVLTSSSAAELGHAQIDRPKVGYNAVTGRYVMWIHKENDTDCGKARAAVASTSTVDGPYMFHGGFRPLASTCRGTSPCTRRVAPRT
ncbi:hypothetical protein Aab01nite_43700 [Paractinoplanes abujensis]|uniref:Glycosyl hydrolase family 43 n=1 Tax=Paractinoplanes abujensis TaxID=882441 RepID=A0A7W7FZ01_9ACTN|nr:hypothetical protein [Actinoplanes abujensis]MBB4690007.1 hypothetical protein [Actinoplanes abujensis]GID20780.1 hypothetical protein Aab01nite_43700 [Actinoplanes abujensis]